MTIGSTKKELHVDIWSGNHPFFTGSQRIIAAPVSYGNGKYVYNLNLSSQAAGVYLVTIGNDVVTKSKKIVVK